MRNLLQYPITPQEVIDNLHQMAEAANAEERIGDMRTLLLREAILEIEEWRECARYDPQMEGPRFKGWDRSQMDRCRKRFIENQGRGP